MPLLPRRCVAAAVFGAAVLLACVGWNSSVGERVGTAALFSWDSYSTHKIRMQHRGMVYAHGIAQPGPLILERKLKYPEADSKDYPYPTNDGTPQWPSNAPIHDTRSGEDDPVWDGTQLYRNWGVPRDGVVVSKDCKFLPRKDCLPSTMKDWRHGDRLPGKDRQFMIEADSTWKGGKGPDGHKLSPGEKEAKDFFEGQSKENKKRLLGALQTQVQAAAQRQAAPVVAIPAGSTYAGFPFYVSPPAAAPYAALGGAVSGGAGVYAAPVAAAAQRQGWNYGQTPLSAPGLGRAALVPMIGRTIPESIMKAFERDDKDWKPVMKKVKCRMCAVAVGQAVAMSPEPVMTNIAATQRAVASSRAVPYTPPGVPPYPASVAPAEATANIPAVWSSYGVSATAVPDEVSSTMPVWAGYGVPVSVGADAPGGGLESPLPIGPGGLAVPGAGAYQANAAQAATAQASSAAAPWSRSVPWHAATPPGEAPSVHVDTWKVGAPHARRNPMAAGTKHVAAGAGRAMTKTRNSTVSKGVVKDGNVGAAGDVRGSSRAAGSQLSNELGALPALHKSEGPQAFAVVDPEAAARSGARLAAGEMRVEEVKKTAAGRHQLDLKPSARRDKALSRMESKAAQQGGFVVNGAPQQPRGAPPDLKSSVAASGDMDRAGTYDGIPIELDPPAAPETAPRGPAASMGRAFIDVLASMVERKVANDEGAEAGERSRVAGLQQQVQRRQSRGWAASATQELSQERRLDRRYRVASAMDTERRLIHKLAGQVETIRKDLEMAGVGSPPSRPAASAF